MVRDGEETRAGARSGGFEGSEMVVDGGAGDSVARRDRGVWET